MITAYVIIGLLLYIPFARYVYADETKEQRYELVFPVFMGGWLSVVWPASCAVLLVIYATPLLKRTIFRGIK